MLKGWSLIGDALSHSVVPGVAGAYMLGLPFALGAFLSGGLAALANASALTNAAAAAAIGLGPSPPVRHFMMPTWISGFFHRSKCAQTAVTAAAAGPGPPPPVRHFTMPFSISGLFHTAHGLTLVLHTAVAAAAAGWPSHA